MTQDAFSIQIQPDLPVLLQGFVPLTEGVVTSLVHSDDGILSWPIVHSVMACKYLLTERVNGWQLHNAVTWTKKLLCAMQHCIGNIYITQSTGQMYDFANHKFINGLY